MFKLIEIDLILLLVKIGVKKWPDIALLGAMRMILSNVQNDSNFTKFWFGSINYVNWGN